MRRRTTVALGGLVAACMLLTACGGLGMPGGGPVHESTAAGSNRDDEPASIDPPGPQSGDSREEILRGFLYAMQATPPIKTSVAREFLTQEANASWQPSGMVIYDTYTTPRVGQEIAAQLEEANRTDARGAWLGPVAEQDLTVTFAMEVEKDEEDEWRIATPPPSLLVPATWFDQRFRQVSLYFFDPSATMLIPEPVFVPRGSQFASALVNGLLSGPSPELAATEDSYLPPDLRSLSVPVTANGVAQVELTSDTDETTTLAPEQSELLVSQLAWTLQQDRTISRFRVTIDGRPVQLPGETEFSVEHGHEYAPYVAGSSTLLFGVRRGVMVGGSPQNLETVTGPLGSGGYTLRSASVDFRADQAAAVSLTGTTLWLAPVKDNGAPATRLIDDGEDLLRPAWDFSGKLWEVDRRKSGAVVSYVRDEELHVLDVTGISHEDVKDFLVSPDGSRIVAVVRESAQVDRVVVSRILTSGDGEVLSATAAQPITAPDTTGLIRDIAWRSPTSVLILYPRTRTRSQARSVSVDGTKGVDSLSVPVEGELLALAGTPVPNESSYAFTRGALIDLEDPQGVRIAIDPAVVSLNYVG